MVANTEQPYALTDKNRRILILLPWLALPLVVGCYAVLWSRLPAEMAVKFDLSTGATTDTLGRTTSLLLDAAVLLFVLIQFTLRLWWGARGRDRKAVMATYYVAVVFITAVFLLILKFNL